MKYKRTYKISSNKQKRTFTIRVYWNNEYSHKYRTPKMTKEEFEEKELFTEEDWRQFMNYGEYYQVN